MAFGPRKSQTKKQERHLAEHLAASLPALFLQAEQLASTISTGIHGRHKSGTGEDFWQFRPYAHGDSAGEIDWRQSAKRENPFVRQHELETNESVWLWLDKSLSMTYGSPRSEFTKLESARVFYLALALLLNRSYEDYALLVSGERSSHGPAHIDHFAELLLQTHPTEFGSRLLEGNVPRQSRIVIASDFLMPLEKLKTNLEAAAASGSRGILLHIADPTEVTLPFKGRVRFTDLDGANDLTIGHVENIRDEYQQLFRQHKSSVEQLASEFNWTYIFHQTADNPAETLVSLFRRLSGKN